MWVGFPGILRRGRRIMTIPVYVVAGFLGSGKTTLLKSLLAHLNSQDIKPLVLMNEFGESNIDNELLEGGRASMRELIDGCICCTSKTELTKVLYDIASNESPDCILMEATGLADPVELLDVCTLPNMLDKLSVRSIVSVVDVNRWGKLAQAEALMKRQAGYADILLLNKTDLVDEQQLEKVAAEVRDLNKRAVMHRTTQSNIDPDVVLRAGGTQVENAGKDHSDCDHDHGHCEHDHGHDHAHDHDHGHHHHHGHDHAHDHYLSFTLRPTGVASKAALNDFLNEGLPGLLRVKGFLQVEGVEPQAILQWTTGDWEMIPRPEMIRPKPDVLVFIGDELDRPLIRQKLEACGLKFEAADEHHHHEHEHAHHEH
jgi:G3E family GTPase